MSEEHYMWLVEDTDGGWLGEYDPYAPQGRGWSEIDQAAVKTLALSNWECTQILHQVSIPKGAHPIFFRRRQITLNEEEKEQGTTTIHCIGFKEGGSDLFPLHPVYLFVYPDGRTLLTSDLQAV